VAFEVGVGRFVAGASWGRIGSDYDLFHGGLLPIGLLILAVAPFAAARIRGLLSVPSAYNKFACGRCAGGAQF
jgi:hypothetical protein